MARRRDGYQRILIGACYDGSLPLVERLLPNAVAEARLNAPLTGEFRLMRRAFEEACCAGRTPIAQYLWAYSEGRDVSLVMAAPAAFEGAMIGFCQGTLGWLLAVAGDAIGQAESTKAPDLKATIRALGHMGGVEAFERADTVSPLAALLLQRLHWSKPRAAWISAVLRAKRS